MDKHTQARAIEQLARAVAEIAAEIATATSEAAGVKIATRNDQNQVVGTLIPVIDQIEVLRSTLSAITALHSAKPY